MSSLVGWVSASFCQCQQLLLLSVSVSTSTLLSWTKWSANKQNLHLKSVAGISHHSATVFDNAGHCLGLAALETVHNSHFLKCNSNYSATIGKFTYKLQAIKLHQLNVDIMARLIHYNVQINNTTCCCSHSNMMQL